MKTTAACHATIDHQIANKEVITEIDTMIVIPNCVDASSADKLNDFLGLNPNAATSNVGSDQLQKKIQHAAETLAEGYTWKVKVAKDLAVLRKVMLAGHSFSANDVVTQLSKEMQITEYEVRCLLLLHDTLQGEHKKALKQLKPTYMRLIDLRILCAAINVKNQLSNGVPTGDITAIEINDRIMVTLSTHVEPLDLAAFMPEEFVALCEDNGSAEHTELRKNTAA